MRQVKLDGCCFDECLKEMSVETMGHVRAAFALAKSGKQQDLIVQSVLYDSVRGNVHYLCPTSIKMLFGIGARRLSRLVNELRNAHSLAVETKEHALRGVSPANKTDAAVEEELLEHVKVRHAARAVHAARAHLRHIPLRLDC